MTLDFAGAIKEALDKSTVDDQVAADVAGLLDRIAKSGPKGDTNFVPSPPTDGQLEMVTRRAIQDHGLMAVIEQAIVDEVIRAAKTPAAAPVTK